MTIVNKDSCISSNIWPSAKSEIEQQMQVWEEEELEGQIAENETAAKDQSGSISEQVTHCHSHWSILFFFSPLTSKIVSRSRTLNHEMKIHA